MVLEGEHVFYQHSIPTGCVGTPHSLKSVIDDFAGLHFLQNRDIWGYYKDILCPSDTFYLSARTYYVGAWTSDVIP